MKDAMIDLETWGTTPGSHLRSIGVVAFDPVAGTIGEKFYCNIARFPDHGLTRCPDTVDWWNGQSAEARAALETHQEMLGEALRKFSTWYHRQGIERVWGHGATFDPVLTEMAFRAAGLNCPWDHRAARDTRTLFDLAAFDKSTVPPVGTAHNAVDDAEWQALAVIECYRLLGKQG